MTNFSSAFIDKIKMALYHMGLLSFFAVCQIGFVCSGIYGAKWGLGTADLVNQYIKIDDLWISTVFTFLYILVHLLGGFGLGIRIYWQSMKNQRKYYQSRIKPKGIYLPLFFILSYSIGGLLFGFGFIGVFLLFFNLI